MTPPMPTDHDLETELRAALRADAERITPEPALHHVLARAHAGDGPRRARQRRRWLPTLAGAVATAGVVAAAVVFFAPSDDPTGPVEPPPCAVEVREGCPVDLAVYFLTPSTEDVVSASVTVTSSGDVGLDAVQTLLDTRSRGEFKNIWHGFDAMGQDAGPIAQVNEVTHADGVITTDFDRQLLSPLASVESSDPTFAEVAVQQLVLTVQSALRTDDPVRITVNGEPASEAFGQPLSQPVQADWSLVAGIRPEAPQQDATVSSPLTITGTSDTFEGNVLWEVTRDGEIVREGYTSGGANGLYDSYRIRVELDPGDYTVKLWEPNQASGAEAWAAESSVTYTDFTVE